MTGRAPAPANGRWPPVTRAGSWLGRHGVQPLARVDGVGRLTSVMVKWGRQAGPSRQWQVSLGTGDKLPSNSGGLRSPAVAECWPPVP